MEMKLYAFSTGSIRVKKGIFAPGRDDDKLIEAPVQCFLIIHPKGAVLVDTGIDYHLSKDPEAYWGKISNAFYPLTRPGTDIFTQLENIGYGQDSIGYVILSHMHMDHVGNNRYFTAAGFFVQEAEYKTALKPDSKADGYYRRDWDYPLLYKCLKGRKDLFDDGRIVMEPLPGHTDGMQVVIVDMPKSGKIVLASDAAAMTENLEHEVVPRNIKNKDEYLDSIRFLKRLKDEGALIICGHDPEQWNEIKTAPDYYE
jgi:N-acyl homoserine lactone hydrolase